jgi:hypothetical protein
MGQNSSVLLGVSDEERPMAARATWKGFLQTSESTRVIDPAQFAHESADPMYVDRASLGCQP